MSKRTLGGGRVLGSSKSLSPAVPSPQFTSNHRSPSASTLSLNSQTSTPPSSESQDIASRISLDHGDSTNSQASAAATARLVCPICNDEMVTLLQLNRHLDDVHRNLEDERQDEIQDWFKAQMVKAKRFQPLAVLNQKLKGLDVFESNDQPEPVSNTRYMSNGSPAPPEPLRTPALDPDEVVSRSHWQRRGPYDVCSEPMCGKRLTSSNGSINCRHCGKLFCEEHTMYQMKLSRSAKHEPVRGLWCRVCETCYKSRPGYNDHHGLERDHHKEFEQLRRHTVDKAFLELSRLEKRLTKLTQLLANPPPEAGPVQSKRWSLSWGQNDPRKALEQSVVTWQDDASVSRCPTCGKVVCGDPMTGCSTEVGLNVDAATSPESAGREKALVPKQVPIDVRLCRECKTTLFDKRDFAAAATQSSPFTRAYDNLIQFERGIRLLLPKFQKHLTALQDPDKPPPPSLVTEASKTRKRLMDSFTQYDVAARRIRDMPSESPTQLKLQKAIHQQASNFLHLHMLPLKTLPKILKHATPHGSSSILNPNSSSPTPSALPRNGPSALASINFNGRASTPSILSSNSSQISTLEAEEKSLRERLIVLEEQRFFVQEMMTNANKRRKFDELEALRGNEMDLGKEIDSVQGQLAQLDFRGAYTGTGN
ncbi:MAG: hypothetical protein Q9227_003878 [Pyrenula ochraceoflavens]